MHLLDRTPLIDGHNDLPWALRTLGDPEPDLAAGEPRLHTDLPRLRAGKVGAQFWSVYVPCTFRGPEAVAAVVEQVERVHQLAERYPDALRIATTADEVEAAFAEGRIGSLLGAEGGHSIGGSLRVLRALRRSGVRYLTLAHNSNSEWADSATDEPEHGGLSAFGREVVAEMNRIGMIVDLSHVAPTTMRAALDTTRAPVLFTHSSARAVTDHPRNVPDDVLVALPANGGVCMVTFVPRFVSATPDEATLDDVVAHLEHVRDVAGIDHVGIGGDYDGVAALPAGLEDVSGYPRLFDALAARGWTDADLGRLAGQNVLRVLRAVDEVA